MLFPLERIITSKIYVKITCCGRPKLLYAHFILIFDVDLMNKHLDLLKIKSLLWFLMQLYKECNALLSPNLFLFSICLIISEDIVEFELLDNYTSYEADAARHHFEEVMKETAQENGKKKVDLLIKKYKPNTDGIANPIDKVMAEMSYEYFITVKDVLVNIYPKLHNEDDNETNHVTKEEWSNQTKIFRQSINESTTGRLEKNMTKFMDENTPLLEI